MILTINHLGQQLDTLRGRSKVPGTEEMKRKSFLIEKRVITSYIAINTDTLVIMILKNTDNK
jgi:hypothetical protein